MKIYSVALVCPAISLSILLCLAIPVKGEDTAKTAVVVSLPTATTETDRAVALFHDAMDRIDR